MQTKFKIVETEEYLLAISDEEIKEGEYCLADIYASDFYGVVLYNGAFAKHYFRKIIAYQPKNNAPELDLPLLPEIVVEDDAEKLAENYKNKKGSIPTTELEDEIFKLGFKDGYKAATKVYTEEDLRNAINMGIDLWMNSMTDNSAELTESDYQQIIQSLKQSKTTPKWFVAEIEEQRTATYGGVIVRELKTTTNSEGKQVLVGTYLFE
jgi:hypothetical protein